MAKKPSELAKNWTAGLNKQQAVFVVEYLKDFGARRAAVAAGYDPDYGYKLINEHAQVRAAIQDAVTDALGEIEVDPTWILCELIDNHKIARMQGNLAASNTALKTLMRHVNVDAMAKQKVEQTIIGDHELMERLHRGRARVGAPASVQQDDEQKVSFL